MGKTAAVAVLLTAFNMTAAASESSHIRSASSPLQDAPSDQDDSVVNGALIGLGVGIGVVVLGCMAYYCWRWSTHSASSVDTEQAFLRNSWAFSGEGVDVFPEIKETPIRSAIALSPSRGVPARSAVLNRGILSHTQSSSSMGLLYEQDTPTR